MKRLVNMILDEIKLEKLKIINKQIIPQVEG